MATKTCKVCGEIKEAAQGTWVVFKGKPIGKVCRACDSAASLAKYRADPARQLYVQSAALSRYYNNPAVKLQNKVAGRLRYATVEGRLKALAASANYCKKHPAKAAAYTMKRHTAKLARQPAWANLDKIQLFYAEAARLSNATGTRYEVDHIIPLQGKLVSGLHVHNNLQVITKTSNSSKGNKFDLEYFNNKFVI